MGTKRGVGNCGRAIGLYPKMTDNLRNLSETSRNILSRFICECQPADLRPAQSTKVSTLTNTELKSLRILLGSFAKYRAFKVTSHSPEWVKVDFDAIGVTLMCCTAKSLGK